MVLEMDALVTLSKIGLSHFEKLQYYKPSPEDYHFIEKTEKLKSTIIGRLIGNAVPVKLAEAIGYTIKNHIKYSCS